MVDDFREYARTPPAVMQRINFNALVADDAVPCMAEIPLKASCAIPVNPAQP